MIPLRPLQILQQCVNRFIGAHKDAAVSDSGGSEAVAFELIHDKRLPFGAWFDHGDVATLIEELDFPVTGDWRRPVAIN